MRDIGEDGLRAQSQTRQVLSQPLEPGREYRVTIAAGVRAMDGSTLDRPHVFTFRVSPPRLLAASPVGPQGTALHLDSLPTLQLLFSAAPDAAVLARRASIALETACGGGTVPVRVTAVRRPGDEDPPQFQYTGLTRARSARPGRPWTASGRRRWPSRRWPSP